MTPLFVSCFTPDYADEARGLIETLNAFDLPHYVAEFGNRGDWVRNCANKPIFLREVRATNHGRPLVWIDADARIRQRPTLFENMAADFAAHWKDGKELLGGTLFFGPSDGAGELIEQWDRECKMFPSEWDQANLQRIVESPKCSLAASRLPAPYALIFDLMRDQGPPVIEQMQASRRLRKN